MRPQDVLASVEPERWDDILTTVRESCPELWRFAKQILQTSGPNIQQAILLNVFTNPCLV